MRCGTRIPFRGHGRNEFFNTLQSGAAFSTDHEGFQPDALYSATPPPPASRGVGASGKDLTQVCQRQIVFETLELLFLAFVRGHVELPINACECSTRKILEQSVNEKNSQKLSLFCFWFYSFLEGAPEAEAVDGEHHNLVRNYLRYA